MAHVLSRCGCRSELVRPSSYGSCGHSSCCSISCKVVLDRGRAGEVRCVDWRRRLARLVVGEAPLVPSVWEAIEEEAILLLMPHFFAASSYALYVVGSSKDLEPRFFQACRGVGGLNGRKRVFFQDVPFHQIEPIIEAMEKLEQPLFLLLGIPGGGVEAVPECFRIRIMDEPADQ
ncbi:hypothetical protein CASFOL_009162 [Castilleja foliolosa]|uniref:Uncharacterized protein n=1 Tax=Castilleja foliolosa TaxID=1961234 RepID=A0ABD3E1K3_9LAMI